MSGKVGLQLHIKEHAVPQKYVYPLQGIQRCLEAIHSEIKAIHQQLRSNTKLKVTTILDQKLFLSDCIVLNLSILSIQGRTL